MLPADLRKEMTKHAYLDLPKKGDFSSLAFVKSPFVYDFELQNDDLEPCEIYYSSINHEDIMVASGRSSVQLLPGKNGLFYWFLFTALK